MKLNLVMRDFTIFAALWVGTICNIAAAAKPPVSLEIRQVEAARGVIVRTTPSLKSFFKLEMISAKDGMDVFEIETVGKRVVLRGNTGGSIASAYYHYLKEFCRCDVSWCGSQLALPKKMPLPKEKIRIVNLHKHRVYFNYCTLNYTASWWDWERWEREIDIMAMNGINMPLSVIGLEGVWYHALLEHGFSDEEARTFLVGPTYFAWQWMTNIQGHGGPLPKSWIDKRIKLGRKIIQRQLALGMTPIQQGFSGCVPSEFKEKFPDADVVLEKSWLGFPGTAQLDPLDPLFAEFGRTLIETQTRLFGTSHVYAADPFHEGHPPKPGDDYLKKVGEAIFKLMTDVDPEATWAMQAWSIREHIACAVPKGRLLVLDLSGGRSKDDNSFWGHNFIKGQLHNFGGRINMHGDIKFMLSNPFADVAKKTGKSYGMGLFMEAIEQNPVFYASVFDQIWRSEPTQPDVWLADYAERRYGALSEHAAEAWQLMVKDGPYQPYTTGTEKSSIIAARPALDPIKSGPNSGFDIPYKPENLIKAWELLLADYDLLKDSDAYLFDLMDVTRQVLSNLGQEVHKEVSASFKEGDRKRFAGHSAVFLEMLNDVDRLLASRSEYNFGTWYNDARGWATTPEEKKQYEYNAAMLVTIWGPDPDPGIFDYAWREWAGLIRLYYLPRWEKFYAYLGDKLEKGEGYRDAAPTSYGRQAFRANEFYKELADWEIDWIHRSHDISEKPIGNTGALVKKLAQKYKRHLAFYYSDKHHDYVANANAKYDQANYGEKVQAITKADFPEKWDGKPYDLTVDITKYVNQEGEYAVTLLSEPGQRTLSMTSVALLQNKREVMRDAHKGSSLCVERGTYVVEIKEHAFGTKYYLQIRFEEKNYRNNSCNLWIKAK
ncbi:alpha-N-acetylglucosaminidase [Pontiellaceae bacterium B12227]|nr:alpha-N-acetylglucosaminidase [Pontiellaceae bacterium B12227]